MAHMRIESLAVVNCIEKMTILSPTYMYSSAQQHVACTCTCTCEHDITVM